MGNIIAFFILLLAFLVIPDDPVEYPEPSEDGAKTSDEPETYGRK